MKNQRIQRIIDLIQNAVNEISVLKTQQKNGLDSTYKGAVYIYDCYKIDINIKKFENANNWEELVKALDYDEKYIAKFQIMELEGRMNFNLYKQDCIDYVEFCQIDRKLSKLKVKVNNWVQTLQSYVFRELKIRPDYTDAYQTSITKFGYVKIVYVRICFRDYIWIPKTCTFSMDNHPLCY